MPPSLDMQSLTLLTQELQMPQTLEEMLQRVANRAAVLTRTDHASVRVLNAARTRLLVGCRAGVPLHRDQHLEYAIGEGLIGWIGQHAAPLRTGDAEADPRFLQRDDQETRVGSFLGVPLLHENRCIGVLSVTHAEANRFTAEDEQVLVFLAGMVAPYIEIARLERMARLDPITGTLNERALESTLPVERSGASDEDAMLSAAVVDVDGFRRINERLGQAAGDEVLRAVARVLAATLRIGDAVIRYGADTFLLLLPGVAAATASRIAERARRAVEEHDVRWEGRTLRVTVSIGIADRRPEEPRDAVIRRAEGALGSARERGSNSVCLAR